MSDLSSMTSMSRDELRNLCKQASIPTTGKLNKQKMIDLLAASGWEAATLYLLPDPSLESIMERGSLEIPHVLPEEAAPEFEELEVAAEQPQAPAPLPVAAAERKAKAKAPPAPKAKAPVKVARPPREYRNGVGRPRAGGKCAAVWDYLGKHPATTVKELKELAPQLGFNPGNASCEFYVWRKFHGIKS